MVVQDGKIRNHSSGLSKNELQGTLPTQDSQVPEEQLRKTLSDGQSSLHLPKRSSSVTSILRLDDGVVIRVDSAEDWSDHLQTEHSPSPSVLSIISTESDRGKKSHRRKDNARYSRPSRQKTSGRTGERKERYEGGGNRSHWGSQPYIIPPFTSNNYNSQDSLQESSNLDLPFGMEKRKISDTDSDVVDHKRSGSRSGKNRHTSRSGHRSSRIQRRYDKTREEDGHIKDERLEEGTRRRRIIIMVICSVSLFILVTSVALVAATLSLSPTIDQLVRKENEDIFRFMTSTISPYGDVDNTSVNQTSNVTGQPG
ncbi:uncharacterized protein LOC143225643 [Tachypleus tridentatus]|uniref:uncharacterized protein LOC143225643 n=1 Tax=Tachypleus tridentatus TaxID=6853 RepID=UPI003FD567DA